MRRGRRARRMSMTSLIDVIFLLLLFFMLSSTFSRFAEVELTAAGASASAPSDRPPLFLRLSPEALMLNAREVAMQDLPQALADLNTASGSETAATTDNATPTADGDTPPRALIVALTPEVTAQRLTDLLVVLRDVRGFLPTVLGGTS
ncbi:biopolymer transporter ExbD [Pseudooceanicola nitratireducens]|uniref:biopolymer transporter ExbD n=1 Tax=Pseudooceanicola nitratireducens TaxID=517719 RepID=UPI0023F18093|nr:biopolymer transporter ExbD [Pseudooceanicola nitratireducens]MEC7795226.1 biopolymer transporter ExbD [Pseudomonadota bacterium]MEC9104212.1 biopolymer transporter ExbD [Pseudomonadota bacterium]